MTRRRRASSLGILLGAGGGLVLAACSGATASLERQVAAWAQSTSFSADLSRLRGDLTHVDALQNQAGAAMRTECDVLVTDTLDANQQLPTPDQQLTTLLEDGYSAAGNAGHECFTAAAGDVALLARSASERAAARTDFVKAEARYDAIVSTVPGTSP
ncbi:MAG: hypothetical protein ACYDA2_10225 [Acidimicrobiales bacterium]